MSAKVSVQKGTSNLKLKQMAPVTGSSSSATDSPEAEAAPAANTRPRVAAAAVLAASRWSKKKVAKEGGGGVTSRPRAFMTLITDKGKERSLPLARPMEILS